MTITDHREELTKNFALDTCRERHYDSLTSQRMRLWLAGGEWRRVI